MPRGDRSRSRWTLEDLSATKKSTQNNRLTVKQFKESKKRLETDIQKDFFTILSGIPYKGLTLNYFVYAIPNGGYRTKKTAANLKKEGVRPGIPDIHCFVAMPPYHGLYIEMKTETGTLTDSQEIMIPLIRREGHKVVVCRSEASALTEILKYLGMN